MSGPPGTAGRSHGADAALRRAWVGARRQGRRLLRRVTGNAGAYVLLYHRVAPVGRDPWGLVVSPERFAEQMAVLRCHAHPLPFAALARARAAGTVPRNAVAVTFDDGYADNLHRARPILEAHDVPATVFLATGYAGRGARFWWDEVERLILGAHPLPASLHLDGPTPFIRTPSSEVRAPRSSDADVGWRAGRHDEEAGRRRLFLETWEWFAGLDAEHRAAALDQLRDAVAAPADAGESRGLTGAEVRALVRGGLVEVGAHTVSHPVLPALSPARQRLEIERSRADVEALIGEAVTTFSYPHGRYDAETVRLVREAGFAAVGTSARGERLDCGVWDDPRHLQRVSVLDWDGETLLRRLRAGFEP